MTGIANKLIIGTIATGVLGGAGYGVYALTDTTDSIENYLTSSDLKPVAYSNNEAWAKVLKTYKLEKTKELAIQTADITKQDTIRDWCRDILTKKIKSKDDDYKKASKWCVEYETIAEKLKSKTFETKVATLNNRLSKFSPENKAIIEKISVTVSENQDGEKIKKWCEENKHRSYSNDDDPYYQDINSNCLTAP